MTDTESARREWKAFRQTAAARPLVTTLRAMAGQRERCFYCGDSLGVDVDHFAPITVKPESTFVWPNHLWACAACNRKKLNRFPLSPSGEPLIIDPTNAQPWRHLAYDTSTGLLAARWNELGPDPLGQSTTEILESVNFEAVGNGRTRVARRLAKAVAFLATAPDSFEAYKDLIQEIREDEYGLSAWFFVWEGSLDSPFRELRPTIGEQAWRRLVAVAFGVQT